MIRVEEAVQIIHSQLLKSSFQEMDIAFSLNRILAETITADRDFPPFNRVAMDGIAIHTDYYKREGQEFIVEGVQAAGSPQQTLRSLQNCIEVMTGAVLPANSNAVIRYEDLALKEGTAKVFLKTIETGMNVHPQGQDAKRGDVLLSPGQKISAAEVALLASVGRSKVKIYTFPKTAVISSGDELVDIETAPESHQIRRSNSYALQSAMHSMGWPSQAFHLSDNKEEIKAKLQTLIQTNDVLILSGGVSKGKFDFMPQALEELGIQKLFHQVNQRPGKPFWFGASRDKSKVVFALPGNPVSTFLCFYKYIKPWVLNGLGAEEKLTSAILTSNVKFTPALTYFLQVRTEVLEGKIMAHPVAGGGSGDFANLSAVDGFLELPADKSTFTVGEVYPFISFRV